MSLRNSTVAASDEAHQPFIIMPDIRLQRSRRAVEYRKDRCVKLYAVKAEYSQTSRFTVVKKFAIRLDRATAESHVKDAKIRVYNFKILALQRVLHFF